MSIHKKTHAQWSSVSTRRKREMRRRMVQSERDARSRVIGRQVNQKEWWKKKAARVSVGPRPPHVLRPKRLPARKKGGMAYAVVGSIGCILVVLGVANFVV